jgi:3-oxoacyl-[acyl-carrier protein] reductase
MFSIDLTNQRAIVTGSSTGIGRGIAVTLAKAGADIVIHYAKRLDEAEKSAALVREAGRKAVLVRGDFLKPKEIELAMNEAVTGLGGSVDILVNDRGEGAGGWHRRQTLIAAH